MCVYVCTCFCGKYNFPPEDEAAVKKYCEAVSFFFDRGTPIFHMEFIGKDARIYCEDLDVLCPSGKPPKEHVLDDEFLSIWMAIMAEIYPEVHPLQLHIYTSWVCIWRLGHIG